MDNARVDWKYLLREIWSTGFGDREAELIVKDIQPTRAVDPEIENQLFEIGRGDEVTVSPIDDDTKHAEIHGSYLQSLAGMALPQAVQVLLMQHIQRHAASFAMKQMAQQQQMLQAQQAAAQGQPPGSGDPTQAPPSGPPGSPGQGNSMTPSRNVMPEPPGRPPQTTNDGDLQRRLPRSNMQ